MKKMTVKRTAAFTLAMFMLLWAVSCESDSDKAANALPEMAYPLLSEKYFRSDGGQDSEEIFEYDAQGNLTHRQIRWSGEGTTDSVYQYENGRLVRLTKKDEYDGVTTLREYAYQYDANGLLKEISENENGEYAGKTSYLRDASGRIKRVIDYDSADSFIMMFEHKYDAAGHCVEEKKYSAKRIVSRYIYQYDDSGHVAGCMVYDEKGAVLTYRLSYTEDGQLLRKEWLDENRNCYRDETYSFDEKGRRASRTDTKNGAIVQMTYYEAYDENGNCVKESSYQWHDGAQDEKPAWYIERLYGGEKVPSPLWECGDRIYHGDFLYSDVKRYAF